MQRKAKLLYKEWFFVSIGLYLIFCIILINFILQINKKFGPGNLYKMITGRYHKPRNEEKIFFAFEKTLLKNKSFYLENFNVYPEFRGGMDMGSVTVTEIGDIKREIAYHGDVLNTASRIQGQCKNLKQKLLISESLAQKLNFNDTFSSESMGEIRLRGKNNLVKVYSINFYYI